MRGHLAGPHPYGRLAARLPHLHLVGQRRAVQLGEAHLVRLHVRRVLETHLDGDGPERGVRVVADRHRLPGRRIIDRPCDLLAVRRRSPGELTHPLLALLECCEVLQPAPLGGGEGVDAGTHAGHGLGVRRREVLDAGQLVDGLIDGRDGAVDAEALEEARLPLVPDVVDVDREAVVRHPDPGEVLRVLSAGAVEQLQVLLEVEPVRLRRLPVVLGTGGVGEEVHGAIGVDAVLDALAADHLRDGVPLHGGCSLDAVRVVDECLRAAHDVVVALEHQVDVQLVDERDERLPHSADVRVVQVVRRRVRPLVHRDDRPGRAVLPRLLHVVAQPVDLLLGHRLVRVLVRVEHGEVRRVVVERVVGAGGRVLVVRRIQLEVVDERAVRLIVVAGRRHDRRVEESVLGRAQQILPVPLPVAALHDVAVVHEELRAGHGPHRLRHRLGGQLRLVLVLRLRVREVDEGEITVAVVRGERPRGRPHARLRVAHAVVVARAGLQVRGPGLEERLLVASLAPVCGHLDRVRELAVGRERHLARVTVLRVPGEAAARARVTRDGRRDAVGAVARVDVPGDRVAAVRVEDPVLGEVPAQVLVGLLALQFRRRGIRPVLLRVAARGGGSADEDVLAAQVAVQGVDCVVAVRLVVADDASGEARDLARVVDVAGVRDAVLDARAVAAAGVGEDVRGIDAAGPGPAVGLDGELRRREGLLDAGVIRPVGDEARGHLLRRDVSVHPGAGDGRGAPGLGDGSGRLLHTGSIDGRVDDAHALDRRVLRDDRNGRDIVVLVHGLGLGRDTVEGEVAQPTAVQFTDEAQPARVLRRRVAQTRDRVALAVEVRAQTVEAHEGGTVGEVQVSGEDVRLRIGVARVVRVDLLREELEVLRRADLERRLLRAGARQRVRVLRDGVPQGVVEGPRVREVPAQVLIGAAVGQLRRRGPGPVLILLTRPVHGLATDGDRVVREVVLRGPSVVCGVAEDAAQEPVDPPVRVDRSVQGDVVGERAGVGRARVAHDEARVVAARTVVIAVGQADEVGLGEVAGDRGLPLDVCRDAGRHLVRGDGGGDVVVLDRAAVRLAHQTAGLLSGLGRERRVRDDGARDGGVVGVDRDARREPGAAVRVRGEAVQGQVRDGALVEGVDEGTTVAGGRVGPVGDVADRVAATVQRAGERREAGELLAGHVDVRHDIDVTAGRRIAGVHRLRECAEVVCFVDEVGLTRIAGALHPLGRCVGGCRQATQSQRSGDRGCCGDGQKGVDTRGRGRRESHGGAPSFSGSGRGGAAALACATATAPLHPPHMKPERRSCQRRVIPARTVCEPWVR